MPRMRLLSHDALNFPRYDPGDSPAGRYRGCFGVVTGILLLAGVLPICAATLTVSNTNDSGPGSLRDTIAAARPGDTIQFSVTGTITLTSGELLINQNNKVLTITGPGASQLAISGNHASRVFLIDYNTSVIISGLTIENGSANNSSTSLDGGGIYNNGGLTVINSTITGNSASGNGGGILDNGSNLGGLITLTNDTISGNSAGANGGGIFNVGGTVKAINSTVADNSANAGSGGGLYSQFGSYLLINSTVADNSASKGGGFGGDFGSMFAVWNTLLARNLGGNCGVFISSFGYNLSDDNTCASSLTKATDENNIVAGAGLDPSGLQNNGGPTQTIALLPTSPAVDHIPVANCTDATGQSPLTTDQRGVARPQGPACDVGAFELLPNGPVVDMSGAFQVNYVSNLNIGDGVINLTNTGASATATPLEGSNSYGDICVNVYVYGPDQELGTCCSCLVSPNSLHSWPVSFGPGNLLTNVTDAPTLQSIVQAHAAIIKLLATPALGIGTGNGSYCPNPSSPNATATDTAVTGLATGVAAWGTHAYPTNTTQANITETPFVPATLSVGEFGKLTGDCRALLTTGSGYLCPGCRTGGLAVPNALRLKLP